VMYSAADLFAAFALGAVVSAAIVWWAMKGP
jgi:hypothetical protein